MRLHQSNDIVAAYNNPAHHCVSTAVDAIGDTVDPLEAWEKVVAANLVPSDLWRRFGVCAEGEVLWPSSRPPESRMPASIEGILRFASDSIGMLEAEARAITFANRLFPWGAICNREIVWYFTDNPFEVNYLGKPYDSARDSVTLALSKNGFEFDSLLLLDQAVPILIRRALAAWEGWELAVQRGLALDEPRWVDFHGWKSFSDLRNPFEPLIELWRTGYRIISSFTSEDPVIRLYAPPLNR